MDRQMRFSDKIAVEKDLIYDLRYVLNGKKRFFIIKVKPALHNLFKRTISENKGYNLENFGTILFSGYNEPNDEIKSTLKIYRLYSN